MNQKSLKSVFTFRNYSINILFIIAFGLSVLYQGITGMNEIASGQEYFISGAFRLVSIPLLCFLAFIGFRWLKLNKIYTFQEIKTMIPLTFGLYAILEAFFQFNNLNNLGVIVNPQDIGIILQLFVILRFAIAVVFGFSLLKLASYKLASEAVNVWKLNLTSLCLASYGIGNIVSIIHWVSDAWSMPVIFLIDLIPYTIARIGGLMASAAFLFLAFHIFQKKNLSQRLMYSSFLIIGIGWVIDPVAQITRIFIQGSVIGSFWYSSNLIFGILEFLIYLLVIKVAYSLLRGGKWEGRNFKLALTALFLYSGTKIADALISPLNLLFTKVVVPTQILIPGLLYTIIFLTFMSSLLAIGFLLYTTRKQWISDSTFDRKKTSELKP